MNIIFTKKSIALIIIAIMLLGIATPVFATVSDLEFMTLKDIGIEDQGFEEVTEETGAKLPVYDKNGNIIKVLQSGMKIHILALESNYINSIIEQKQPDDAWIKIELEDGTIGFLNLMSEAIEDFEEPVKPSEPETPVEPEKEPETPAEPEVEPEKEIETPVEPEKEPENEPETPAEPETEKDNEFDFIDNILGNSFITEMKNMFKDTLSKVFENSKIFENLNFSDEEKELVEEVETDFKDFVLKFSKVTLQISKRVLSDISKTLFDKIGNLDKDEEILTKPDEDLEKEPEVPQEPEVPVEPEQEPEVPQEPEKEPEAEPEVPQEPEKEPEAEPEVPQEPEKEPEAEPEVPQEPEKEPESEPEVPQEPDEDLEKEPEMPQEPEQETEKQPETTQKTDFLSSIINTVLPNSGKITNIIKNVGELMKPIQNVVSSIFGTTSGAASGLSGVTDIITNVVGGLNLPFLNMF